MGKNIRKLSSKILVTGATLDSINKGCNALTAGAVISLLRRFDYTKVEIFHTGGRFDDFKIQALSFDGKKVKIKENVVWGWKLIICTVLHLMFFFLPKNWKKYLFINHLNVFLFLPAKLKGKKLDKKNINLKKLITADYIINMSSGDAFSDIYGFSIFFRQCADKIIGIAHDRKIIIFPQTIGPFYSPLARLIAGYILRKTEKIYVRENQTKKYLEDTFNNLPQIEEANDMAFLMEPEKVKNPEFEKFISSGIHVGVNISGFLYDHPTGKNRILGKKVSYSDFAKKIIQTLLDINEEIKIVMISHVEKEDVSANLKVLEHFTIKGFSKRFYLLDEKYNAQQTKYFISQVEFFTGARLHGCIAALSTSVPTVLQAYSYKFLGVAEKLKMEEYVIDLKNDDLNTTIEKIKIGFKNRQEIKNHLLQIHQESKEEAAKCAALN